MIIIWHNPRCSKSRQSLELLESRGEEVTIRKYLDNPPTKDELSKILDALQMSASAVTRKKETLYRELELKGKSEEMHFNALLKHPKLLERPIVVKGDQARIGRPLENILEIL